MKRSTRMLLMNANTRRGREYPDARQGYDGPRQGYDGYGSPRQGYDGPQGGGYTAYPEEGRFRDRRGREHYDDGRFAPQGRMGGMPYGEGGGWEAPHHRPFVPPYYDGAGREPEPQPRTRNRIGFSVDGQMERIPDGDVQPYRSTVGHPQGDEMQYRGKAQYAMGFAGHEPQPLTKEKAMEWVKAMQNGDGTQGPHWSMEQTRQVQAQKGIDKDPVEFFAAMNMMYSDYCKAAKKLGVNESDFYACLAEAFLDDKDAQPHKLARYYECIVKH